MKKSQPEEAFLGEATRIPNSVVVAAHELKHPLVLIRQLALGLDAAENPRDYAQRIRLTSEQALRLTNNITRHARLEDSFFATETYDAYMVCRDVAREIEPLYEARGRAVRVERARHHRQPLVAANLDLLRRILLTFTENALEYAGGESTVKLSVQRREKEGVVRFLVRDFGPGVSQKNWRNLTENGARGEYAPVASDRPLSSGLGLGIARRFAEAMNGSVGLIRHRSGATFFVDIPESKQMRLL